MRADASATVFLLADLEVATQDQVDAIVAAVLRGPKMIPWTKEKWTEKK